MAFASAGQSRLNLSSPFNDLARGLNDKQQIDTVLLDFSKAFDRVRKRGISVVRHLPLVLEVPGSIPARGEKNFGVRARFL